MYDFQLKGDANVTWVIPWQGIARIALMNVGKHFNEELGPNGPWPDLKPETWARKQGDQMLWETGALSGSYDMGYGEDYAEVFSTGVDYAIYHDKGTRFMPARSFLWIDDEAWAGILKLGGESLTWS